MFPRRFAPLPLECDCGDTAADQCSQLGLDNHRKFPPFRDLIMDDDYDALEKESYFEHVFRAGLGYWQPRRHWALVGGIVRVDNFFHRATLQTRYGESVVVDFHLEQSSPAYFGWNLLVPGNTMVVFYPVRDVFLDGTTGIRQEDADTFMVFPVQRDRLSTEVRAYQEGTCVACRAPHSANGTPLQKCARCRRASYCGRECQVQDWKEGHKRLCRYSEKLYKLANLDFGTFNGYLDWSFVEQQISFRDVWMERMLLEMEYERRFFSRLMLLSFLSTPDTSSDDYGDEYDHSDGWRDRFHESDDEE